MKKLFLAILLAFAFDGIAQSTYQWDYYGLKIDVPDDFKVTKNTDTEFEMSGKHMMLFMYLFEEDISVEEMDMAIAEAALSLSMSEIDAAQKISGDGLDGYYVEGFKDGMRVMLAGMIDPNSKTNFMLMITFQDDDQKSENRAMDIINSVRTN